MCNKKLGWLHSIVRDLRGDCTVKLWLKCASDIGKPAVSITWFPGMWEGSHCSTWGERWKVCYFQIFSSFDVLAETWQVKALNIAKMTKFQVLVLVIDRAQTLAIILNPHGIKIFQDDFSLTHLILPLGNVRYAFWNEATFLASFIYHKLKKKYSYCLLFPLFLQVLQRPKILITSLLIKLLWLPLLSLSS